MQVTFYDFKKKANSTARPASGGVSYECVLKEACSVIQPTIRLDKQQLTTYSDYTYAFIPEFGRYYFVTDIRNAGLLWEYDLRVDVLATFKVDIGAASLFVTRSSAEKDEGIKDTLYPVTAAIQTQTQERPSPFIHDLTGGELRKSDGCFVLGVVNNLAVNALARYGSLVYYIVSANVMPTIIEALLSDAILSEFSDADGTLALQKSIIDPAQFIKSCLWIPELYETFQTTEQQVVRIWDWEISARAKILAREQPWLNYGGGFTLLNHPQAATRGRYCNGAPYTQQILEIPPFGTIELDTDRTAEAVNITYTMKVDMLTGDAVLTIFADGSLLDKRSAKVGVPIQLTQVTRDYVGAVSSVLGTVGGVLTGDIGGIGTGIQSFINSVKPVSASLGQNGAMVNLFGNIHLYNVWHIIADDDNTRNGRPLCKIRQISQIPGYIEVQKGVVEIAGTEDERDEIEQLLEGGFFYE